MEVIGLSVILTSINDKKYRFKEKKTIENNSLTNQSLEFESLKNLKNYYQGCSLCKLSKTRNNIVFGSGYKKSKIMIIGEAPGADEDKKGLPFIGRAGKLLTKMIHSIGIDRNDVFITNVVKCRPPNNRDPEKDEIMACQKILINQLSLVSPKIIVTLGNVSIRSLIPDIEGITKIRGNQFNFNGWTLIPTFHPSYLLRNRNAMYLSWKDFKKIQQIAFEEI